jgi:hypothetical protein
MGSELFEIYSRGKSANDAYNRAVEDAELEYGHQQGYSGAINSTPGFTDVTNKFKSSNKSLNSYIKERLDTLNKRQGAECICIEEPKINVNKIKTCVEHIVEKGTKKWILLYCVYEDWSGNFIASFNKKGDAVTRARQHTEKTQAETHVKIEKKLEKGNSLTAKITYKKSTNEKQGTWVFYGWASC